MDNSPNDAPRRAIRWMAPSLARQYTTAAPGSGGAPWRALEKVGGYTKASGVEQETGKETGLRVTRSVLVTVTQFDRAKKPFGDPDVVMVSMVLVRETASAPWRVLRADLS